MNSKLLKASLIMVLGSLIFSSCSNDDDESNPETTSDEIVIVPFFTVNENGETPTDADELIYEIREQNPVLDREGNHLTWGEFSTVKGTVEIECMGDGVEVALALTGLIPNGVYTIWNAVLEAPGMDLSDDLLGIDGLGTAGIGDGSDNTFVASPAGKAQLSIYSPGGPLSMVQNLDLGNCPLTDNFEWHIVGSYHLDNKTHGPNLGPDGTVIEQFAFIFQNEDQ